MSSYCGLVDAKIRASDKDLPVHDFFPANLGWIKIPKYLGLILIFLQFDFNAIVSFAIIEIFKDDSYVVQAKLTISWLVYFVKFSRNLWIVEFLILSELWIFRVVCF